VDAESIENRGGKRTISGKKKMRALQTHWGCNGGGGRKSGRQDTRRSKQESQIAKGLEKLCRRWERDSDVRQENGENKKPGATQQRKNRNSKENGDLSGAPVKTKKPVGRRKKEKRVPRLKERMGRSGQSWRDVHVSRKPIAKGQWGGWGSKKKRTTKTDCESG